MRREFPAGAQQKAAARKLVAFDLDRSKAEARLVRKFLLQRV